MQKRHYRNTINSGLEQHSLVAGETDLAIYLPHGIWNKALEHELMHTIITARCELQEYIIANPEFAASHQPIKISASAPNIVREMGEAAAKASVGPMAAVAGQFAKTAGHFLLGHSSEVIVENGGDIFLAGEQDFIIGVYAGPQNPFTGRLRVKICKELLPCGICTSSGTVGKSFSYGVADAAMILAKDAALADAAASAAGNIVKTPADVASACDFALNINGVLGALIVCQSKMAAAGMLELVPL